MDEVRVGSEARTRRVRLSLSAAVFCAVLAPQSARAQIGCVVTPGTFGSAADVCRKADDLFRFLVPQIGVAVSGGNPVPGEGGTMGGWGRRAFSFRAVVVDGYVPDNTVPLNLTGSAVASDFGAARTPVPLPSIDAAIGLTRGIPFGLTNIGGVDLLVGASALPKVTTGSLQIEPKGNGGVAFSFGARVGLLQESSVFPGVSVSYMQRKLPTVDLGYTPGNDTLRVAGTSVKSQSIRLVASKRLPIVGFAIGVGRDNIEGSSQVSAVVNETVLGTAQRATVSVPLLAEKISRNTAFVNLSLNLVFARLVAEAGWSSAGEKRPTLNTFGGRTANEGYRYGSLGLTTRF
mgnify:CR=1 FL=1